MDQEYLQLARKNGKENCPSIIAFLFLREREKGGEDEVKKKLPIDPQHKSVNKANKTIQLFSTKLFPTKLFFLTKFAFIFVRF